MITMKKLVSGMVRLYRYAISPLLPNRCIYIPSCSQYMLEAIELHGILRGLALGLWRILRCNPFAHGGYDPVPEEFTCRRHHQDKK